MDFQSEKSFGKLRQSFPTIQSNPMFVEACRRCRRLLSDYYLRHASTYIGFDCMVGKLSVSAFQNFFRIENPLNINEVMSKNVFVCFF